MKNTLLLVSAIALFPLTTFGEEAHHAHPAERTTEHQAQAKAIALAPTHAAERSPAHTGHEVHWTYAGEAGPEHWGKISPDFTACSQGKHQSPVDLKWSSSQTSRNIELHYQAMSPTVVDNGHTIQVNVPPGSYAMIDGKKYSLAQFHFHSMSEHSFSGRHFPLEAHFVHKDEQGHLAVVGVMFDEGRKNEELEKIFVHFPSKALAEERLPVSFNPASLLPRVPTHYRYDGSLTTPPCSEGVSWTVLNTPLEISSEQISAFNHLYVNNNRPVQPLHNRSPASFR